MTSKEKAIVFDFGNVLIDLDFKKCIGLFEETLKVDWQKGLPESALNALKKYEKGEISDEALIWAFQQFNPQADPRDLIYAWNSILGEIKAPRFDMLKNLAGQYKLAILSNINNLHLIEIHKYLETRYNETTFEDKYFDIVFYSHLIGMRKPDVEIYQHVTDNLGVERSNILFIDDMQQNIDAALNYGWKAARHVPGTEIVDNIEQYILEAKL